MYLLCQRSRKRRKLRKKPRPPLVLLQWRHHLQSTRPAQGNTVRLSLLLVINYYLVLHDVWIQVITLIIKGFIVLMKQQHIRYCANVSQMYEKLANVWEIEDKLTYCFVSVQLQSLRVERYSWPALEEKPCKGFRLWLFPALPHPSLGPLSCSTALSLETLANSYC